MPSRPPKPRDSMPRRLQAVAAVLFMGTLFAISIAASLDPREDQIVSDTPRTTDPLGDELGRCADMRDAALEDAACLSAWAENRRRFMGQPNRQPPSVNEHRAARIPARGTSESEPR